MRTRHSATSGSDSHGRPRAAIIFMYVPDYDEYYSLTEYAARFSSDPDKVVSVYFRSRGALNNLLLSEVKVGNDLFRKDVLSGFAERGEDFEIKDLIDATNSLLVFEEREEVFAHLFIYNDFIAFLLEHKVTY